MKGRTKLNFSHKIVNDDQYFEKEYGVLKNAQVQLFTSIVKTDNNQRKSIINEQQEYMHVQAELNAKLVQHIQQINEFSTAMLEKMREQKEEFDRRGRIEKRNRLYSKQVINHMAYTMEQYDLQVKKQNRLIDTMNEKVENQAALTNQIESNVTKMRTILRNLSRKQSYYFEEIMSRLSDTNKSERLSSKAQESFVEMHNQLTDRMEAQHKQQTSDCNEVKMLLQKILKESPDIRTLLISLPPNYPMKKVRVTGKGMAVDHFLFLNELSGIAYFSLDNEIIAVAVDKVEAIYWG